MADKEIWEEHDLVFHYTTQAGLEGILRSQSLHATHYRYLNDPTEMTQMLPKLEAAIRPSVKRNIEQIAERHPKIKSMITNDGGIDKVADNDAHTVVSALSRVTFGVEGRRKFFEPYITSFCGHKNAYERENGLLSQWRAYGSDAGYAIVFDTRALVEAFKRECNEYFYSSGHFGDVIYEGDDEGFESEFRALLDEVKKVHESMLLGPDPEFVKLYSLFVDGASRFKHKGFQEEKEVRLVLSPMDTTDVEDFRTEKPAEFERKKHKKLKQPQFKDHLRPYLDILGSRGGSLPIRKILIGPHREKSSRQFRLERFLEISDLDIPVSASETPLV